MPVELLETRFSFAATTTLTAVTAIGLFDITSRNTLRVFGTPGNESLVVQRAPSLEAAAELVLMNPYDGEPTNGHYRLFTCAFNPAFPEKCSTGEIRFTEAAITFDVVLALSQLNSEGPFFVIQEPSGANIVIREELFSRVYIDLAGGDDTVELAGLRKPITVMGARGNDTISGDARVAMIDGGSGDDKLSCSGTSVTLRGQGGNDTLVGIGLTLDGGSGSNTISEI